MRRRSFAATPRAHAARSAVLLLILALCFSVGLGGQTTQDRVLTIGIGRPQDAGMSGPVLKAAVSLYSEAVARGDILGAVLLVARHGNVVV